MKKLIGSYTAFVSILCAMICIDCCYQSANAQNCDSVHSPPGCQISGALSVVPNNTEVFDVVIANSGGVDAVVYSFPKNSSGSTIGYEALVSYSSDSDITRKQVYVNVGLSGSFTLKADVTVTYSDGCVYSCSASKSVTVIKQKIPKVTVYPNPVSTVANFHIENIGRATLTITNQQGKPVYQGRVNNGDYKVFRRDFGSEGIKYYKVVGERVVITGQFMAN